MSRHVIIPGPPTIPVSVQRLPSISIEQLIDVQDGTPEDNAQLVYDADTETWVPVVNDSVDGGTY